MDSYVYKIILPAEIDRSFPFLCRYHVKGDVIAESVRKHGVIQPIIVHGRRIISGHSRLLAAEACGLTGIPALDIQKPCSDPDLFLLAILSNWNQQWTELDRMHTIRQAGHRFHLKSSVLIEEVLPALGISAEKHILEEYRLISELDKRILESISEGRIPFRGAKTLARFNSEDQRTFSDIIASKAALTTNQLLKISEWLSDLLKKQRLSLREYLPSSGLEAILLKSKEDPRANAHHFFEGVRALRFPQVARREKEFGRISAEFHRDEKEISVTAPAFFEDEGIVLHAKLKEPESIERVLDFLQKKRKTLNSLFEIVL